MILRIVLLLNLLADMGLDRTVALISSLSCLTQELLNDMLDSLHEDCNKVVAKPCVEALDDDWVKVTPLRTVGEESWRRLVHQGLCRIECILNYWLISKDSTLTYFNNPLQISPAQSVHNNGRGHGSGA